MEGFARSFLGAALRIHADPSDPTGLIERYSTGLLAGCDAVDGCWLRPTDRSQTIVEAAAIALGLTWTKPWLFDQLSAAEQRSVTDYLGEVSGKATPNNNWHLFTVVVDEFCQQTTSPGTDEYRTREEEITAKLDLLEQWYRGNGWYGDGPIIAFDHYCGWALHLYSMMWALAAADRRADARRRLRIYSDRLQAFLDYYALTFADDGAPLHFGRSLIYRHATVAPLWLGHIANATTLEPGTTRSIASHTLRYFLEHGAFSAADLPNLGWHHPFLPMVQSYSGPASPLWSMKGFLGLLLPAEHPVWTDVERRPPWHGTEYLGPSGIDGVLLSRSPSGIVRIANYGSNHSPRADDPSDPTYSRIGYSSHTGPLYREPADGRADSLDQGLSIRRNGVSSHRRYIHRRRVSSNRPCAAAAFRPLWPGVTLDAGLVVLSVSTFAGDEELRVHLIRSPRPGDLVIDGGAAIAGATVREAPSPTVNESEGGPSMTVQSETLTGWSRGIWGWQKAIALSGATAFDDTPRGCSTPTPPTGAQPTAMASAVATTLAGDDLTVLVSGHGLGEARDAQAASLLTVTVHRLPDKVEVTLGPVTERGGSWHLLVPLESLDCSFEQTGYIP